MEAESASMGVDLAERQTGHMIRDNSTQLANAIADRLLREMYEGQYKDAEKLPRETKIAADIGVSRTALRDGVAILEREGFVTRKWGVGTIINHHILAVKARLDIEEEFMDLIRHCSMEPKIVDVKAVCDEAQERDIDIFGVKPGDVMIRVRRTILADGMPTIFCTDSFPKSFVRVMDYEKEELFEPIFNFLSRRCGKNIVTDLTAIHAENATGIVKEELQVEEGEAVLYLNEIGYDLYGNPVLHSDEYYREGVITQTVLRKKLV